MAKVKNFLKNNWLMLILIAIILGGILKYAKSYEQFDIRDEFSIRFCHFLQEDKEKDYNTFCNNILKEQRFKNDTYSNVMCQKYARDGIEEGTIKSCQNVLALENEPKDDFYIMFSNMLFDSPIIRLLNPFSFLIIVIPSLLGICTILKRKYIVNATTRESYKDFLLKFLKKAYRYVWILPVLALFMIIVSILCTTFDHTYSLNHLDYVMWNLSTIQNRYLFILGYVGNILLYSFLFINIGLIVVRKYHNTFVAIIVSYLSYLGLELIFELIVNTFINLVFHNGIGHVFNIMNMWTYSDSWGLIPLLVFSITMCILSFIGVYLSYKDKEKLVISCEKNN